MPFNASHWTYYSEIGNLFAKFFKLGFSSYCYEYTIDDPYEIKDILDEEICQSLKQWKYRGPRLNYLLKLASHTDVIYTDLGLKVLTELTMIVKLQFSDFLSNG